MDAALETFGKLNYFITLCSLKMISLHTWELSSITMFSRLFSVQSISILLVLARPLFAVDFEDSCKDFDVRGDVRPIIIAAVNTVQIAANAYDELEQALNLQQGIPKSPLDLLPPGAVRINNLLTTFFIPPNVTPGFTTAAQGLLGEIHLSVCVKGMLIERF